MIKNSLFASATLVSLGVFGLISRLDFLAPYKKALLVHCGRSLAFFLGAFGLNLFAASLGINRKLLLKDTGRKLSHFDKQLQAGVNEDGLRFIEESR